MARVSKAKQSKASKSLCSSLLPSLQAGRRKRIHKTKPHPHTIRAIVIIPLPHKLGGIDALPP